MSFKLFDPGTCRCCWGNYEVLLLLDTTRSMQGAIDAFQAIFAALPEDLMNIKWGVAEYRDFEDFDGKTTWKIWQQFTDDIVLVQNAITYNLVAQGGGDWPEGWWHTLRNVALEWEQGLGGVHGTRRAIVWAGDAPGFNEGAKGYPYPERVQTINLLKEARIKVVALNTYGPFDGLNDIAPVDMLVGGASQVCGATGGICINYANYSDLAYIEDALIDALT